MLGPEIACRPSLPTSTDSDHPAGLKAVIVVTENSLLSKCFIKPRLAVKLVLRLRKRRSGSLISSYGGRKSVIRVKSICCQTGDPMNAPVPPEKVLEASVKEESLGSQGAPGTRELSSNWSVGGGGPSSGPGGRSALGLPPSESGRGKRLRTEREQEIRGERRDLQMASCRPVLCCGSELRSFPPSP